MCFIIWDKIKYWIELNWKHLKYSRWYSLQYVIHWSDIFLLVRFWGGKPTKKIKTFFNVTEGKGRGVNFWSNLHDVNYDRPISNKLLECQYHLPYLCDVIYEWSLILRMLFRNCVLQCHRMVGKKQGPIEWFRDNNQ